MDGRVGLLSYCVTCIVLWDGGDRVGDSVRYVGEINSTTLLVYSRVYYYYFYVILANVANVASARVSRRENFEKLRLNTGCLIGIK